MFSIAKVSCVVSAFVVAVSAVVWTAVGDERDAAQRAFKEIAAADEMHTAVLARPDAREALATATTLAGPEGGVLLTGSLYLIGDMLPLIPITR